MKLGQDALGVFHYKKAFIQAFQTGDCMGLMLRTFGDARNVLKSILTKCKISQLVIHLAPFDYDHVYPIKKLKKQIILDAKFIEKLAKKYPNTLFMISPFCEHNHKKNVMAPLFADLRRVAPSCWFVNSIWKGEEVAGTVTEIHIPKSKNLPKRPQNQFYTVALDGLGGDGSGDSPDIDMSKVLEKYSDAMHLRVWNFRHNGKFGHKDETPINKRNCWPSVHYLKGHRALLEPRQGSLTWSQNSLYKPFSDDHGGGAASKDNKAMCILQLDKETVKVFDSKGIHIATMNRVRPNHMGTPKGARYYADVYAYQIAEIAIKNTGNALIRIDDMPLTDGRLRSGLFR
jgi:hypothetical protein